VKHFTFLELIELIESVENAVSRELVKLCVTVIEQYMDAHLNKRGLCMLANDYFFDLQLQTKVIGKLHYRNMTVLY
jgi:hypothetical protein